MTNLTNNNQLEEMNREELLERLYKNTMLTLCILNEFQAEQISFGLKMDKLNRTLDKYKN